MPKGVYPHRKLTAEERAYKSSVAKARGYGKWMAGRYGEKANNWNGGRQMHRNGYIYIYSPDHPYCDRHKMVFEHRLVVERLIGRYLLPKEEIHHLNKIKHDNKPNNLVAFIDRSSHQKFEMGLSVSKETITFDGREYGHANRGKANS